MPEHLIHFHADGWYRGAGDKLFVSRDIKGKPGKQCVRILTHLRANSLISSLKRGIFRIFNFDTNNDLDNFTMLIQTEERGISEITAPARDGCEIITSSR